MPQDTLPTVPATAAAPTPGQPYNLSQHPAAPTRSNNPAMTEALNRHAGVAPAPATAELKAIPGQPPRPAAADAPPAKGGEKPAPHVKFIAGDDRETTPATPPEPEVSAANAEPSDEVIKSAPAQLREAYERKKAELVKAAAEGTLTRKQLAEFQSKAKSYEDRIKALEGSESRAKDLEKQVLTYDEQLRITNYTQHPEFHEKFVKPVSDATQSAILLVKDLMVATEDGSERPGTEQDFYDVLAQPNTTLAGRKAKELFGDFAATVIEARINVRKAQQAHANAVRDAGANSAKWQQQQQEAAAAARTQARSEFERVSTEMATKFASLYAPPEGDKDAAAAHQSGEQLARLILEGQPQDMDSRTYLAAMAKVYHRAASWPMHQLRIERLQSELETVKGRLAAYEKSSPDASSRQSVAGQQDAGGAIVTSANDLSAKMRESLERRARSGK